MNRTKSNTVLYLGVLLLSFSLLIDAHGYFSSVTIDGVVHDEGDCMRPHPEDDYDFPISALTRTNGLSTNDMTCGWLPRAAVSANRKCGVNLGSTVTFQFHYEMGLGSSDTYFIDPSHHGPCLVYMAKSETGSGAVWFKIFEDGYNTSSKTWCVDRMRTNGGKFSVRIPTDITPGNYLIRSELIALHEGDQLYGAQPYVHCAEITVAGSGTSNPTNLVSIPGVYTPTDAGIYFDIYDGFKTYPIPGPPIYVSGSGSGSVPTPAVTTKAAVASTGRATTGRATTGRATTGISQITSSKVATPTTGTPSQVTSGKRTSGVIQASSGKLTSGVIKATSGNLQGSTGLNHATTGNTQATSGKSATITTGSSYVAMCYLPGTPNVNGTILKNPPYCGKNAKKARCGDGQCCSKYGFCGPIPDETGQYYEEVDGKYQYVSYDVAAPLYCANNAGDYRKVPCSSIHNKDDVSATSAGILIEFNFLMLLLSTIFVGLWI